MLGSPARRWSAAGSVAERDEGLSAAHLAAVDALLLPSGWVIHHVRQVERIAGWLFAALRTYHGLGRGEATLLRAAALLHDIGFPLDATEHHKVSARMIRNGLGPPFTPEQVELVSLIARYHRRGQPKLVHRRYAALSEGERAVVVWLGGILRVADGLDRAHEARVRGVRAERIDGRLALRVEGSALDEDLDGALRKRDLLERAVGMPVLIASG
jgi:exopolyphosphatase/guanosine-5'-triphosphate,3'-diphosphate pyrophosphatase